MIATKTHPHKAMLYYPIPTRFTDECEEIYAVMGSDHETAVIFGIHQNSPTTVIVCLQGRGDKIVSYPHEGWQKTLKAESGTLVYTKEEARSLWNDLIGRKWVQIPRDQS
jgi:hypothetical protein